MISEIMLPSHVKRIAQRVLRMAECGFDGIGSSSESRWF